MSETKIKKKVRFNLSLKAITLPAEKGENIYRKTPCFDGGISNNKKARKTRKKRR